MPYTVLNLVLTVIQFATKGVAAAETLFCALRSVGIGEERLPSVSRKDVELERDALNLFFFPESAIRKLPEFRPLYTFTPLLVASRFRIKDTGIGVSVYPSRCVVLFCVLSDLCYLFRRVLRERDRLPVF